MRAAEVTFAVPAAPLAGVGKLVTDFGPKVAEACGFKPLKWEIVRDSDSKRKAYWKNAGIGLVEAISVPFRIVAAPFAFGSKLFDHVTLKKGETLEPKYFWSHAGRGVARTGESLAVVPLSPLAGFGKVADWVGRKAAAVTGFKPAAPLYSENASLRRKYWNTVGKGVTEAIKLPFRVVLSPLTLAAAAYWFQTLIRGPELAVVGSFAAVGGVVSALGNGARRMVGKSVEADKTLWGHERSWTGYATDALDSAGRTLGAPFYAVNALLSAPLDFKKGPKNERGFYNRAGRGILQTIGLPLVIPAAVVGGVALGVDKLRGKAGTTDRSVIGLASDATTRTWNGATRVYDTYLRKYVGGAVTAVANTTERVAKRVTESYQRSVARITKAVAGVFGKKA